MSALISGAGSLQTRRGGRRDPLVTGQPQPSGGGAGGGENRKNRCCFVTCGKTIQQAGRRPLGGEMVKR